MRVSGGARLKLEVACLLIALLQQGYSRIICVRNVLWLSNHTNARQFREIPTETLIGPIRETTANEARHIEPVATRDFRILKERGYLVAIGIIPYLDLVKCLRASNGCFDGPRVWREFFFKNFTATVILPVNEMGILATVLVPMGVKYLDQSSRSRKARIARVVGHWSEARDRL